MDHKDKERYTLKAEPQAQSPDKTGELDKLNKSNKPGKVESPTADPAAESAGKDKEPGFSRPIKVLSTSLGLALIANTALVPGGALASNASGGSSEPKLVEFSTDEVKQYYDPTVDWSLPITEEDLQEQEQTTAPSGGSDGTTVVNNYYGGYGSGFGWSDLLLYHFLFNNAGVYSSRGWYDNRRGYYAGSTRPYTPRTYDSGSFQNRSVTGSTVRPKTSNSTGKITRRSTSSGSGGVGGRSSGLSSSGSKSSGSKSGGFFGG